MASTITWAGGTSNDATVASNWVGDILPVAGDTIILPAAGSSGTIDYTGQPGTLLPVTNLTFQSAATADAINFTDAAISGGTITAADGTGSGAFTLSLTDSTADTVSWFLGDFATLDLTGSTATSTQIFADHGQSMIKQLGTGDTLTINATGTVTNDALTWLTNGGQAALNIAQDGTSGGYYGVKSGLLVIGSTLTVSGDLNAGTRFSNNGFMLLDGQSALAEATLDARLNSITGEIDLLGGTGGALLDVNTNMPGAQEINFGDSVGLLKIEASTTLPASFDVVTGGTTVATTVLQEFFGRITGFKPGNEGIMLVGVNPTGLSYSFGNDPNYGSNLLTLSNAGTEVARLRFPSANLVDGTGTFDGANTGNFVLSNDGSGDTLITLTKPETAGSIAVTGSVAQWAGVTSGGTTDWSAASEWAGGTGTGGLPGQFQTAQISFTPTEGTAFEGGSFNNYVITVTTAETVGSVVIDDPLASMAISVPLTLAAVPGQSSGGEFLASEGNGITIDAGGVLTTSRYYAGKGSNLSLDTGGALNVAGVAPLTAGSGLAGLDVEGNGQTSGGTINATGNIIIGQNSNGSFTAENNILSSTSTSENFGTIGSHITATYTQVGGNSVQSGADQEQSNLQISGPNTTWSDVGGDTLTPFSGAMLVGGGEPNLDGLGQVVLPRGGVGMVEISNDATLTDQSYAIIGLTTGSHGTVELDNGAQWHIGTGTHTPPGSIVVGNSVVGTGTLFSSNVPWLVVGSGGTGMLNINNSSTVELGTGAEFNTAKMIVGTGNNSNDTAGGVVNVQGAGALLDTGGGPMVVGHRSDGSLNISNGGTVVVSADTATADASYGIIIGNQNGTVGFTSGVVNINAGGLLIDNGDLVDGRNSAGTLSIGGGSAQVTGALYLGGFLALENGTHAIAPTLVHSTPGGFTNPVGTLDLSGTGVMIVASNTADIWQGSRIDLNGGGVLAIGNTGTVAPLAGELTVAAGATLQGAGTITVVSTPSTLQNFGTVLAGGLTSSGTADQIGATLELSAVLAGPGVFKVAPGGTLQLDSSAVNTSNFAFSAPNSNSEFIRVMAPTAFQGTVGDFYGGHRIDFVNASVVVGQQPTYTPNADPTTGGTVQVNTGDGLLTFHVTGYHPGGFFDATDPAGTGTQVVANDAAPCFAAGTRILTASGEVAVEDLRIGDRLPTLTGALRAVRWIGWTRIDLDRHAHPERVAPVRVQAHAFGPGAPHRELLLSPDHAVALDGALIPVHRLVNGASIVRAPARGMVRYFHLELDAHAILFADGLPAESYLDTGNRGQFANAGDAHVLHPEFDALAWDERACAPLLLTGVRVTAAHARLVARAEALGHRLTDDPGLSIIAGGAVLAVTQVSRSRMRVTLPAGTHQVELRSRRSVPQHFDAGTDDDRPLGVAIRAARHSGRALVDAAFAGGFYPWERYEKQTWRWTDGEARLELAPRRRASVLEFILVPGWRRYWETPLTPAASASVS